MTLNSDGKVSWDCFWVERWKGSGDSPALFTCLVVVLIIILHFHIEMAKGWHAKVYLVSGARQVDFSPPYLKQAE